MIRRVWAALYYVFFLFLKELALANWAVVKLVLSPSLPIRPGFVAVPLDAKTDFEVTSFANSITLTPGTISVHISDDRTMLVMHAVDTGDDLDALRQATKASLEAPILRFTRGERRR